MSLLMIILVYAVFSGVGIFAKPEDHNTDEVEKNSASSTHTLDKRYVAALAKNGRLPHFLKQHKKDDLSDDASDSRDDDPEDFWIEDKRHVGAFLKSRGKPHFERVSKNGNALEEDDEVDAVKRNIASLARLGRLNAIRYGSFRPRDAGSKRVDGEDPMLADEDGDEEEECGEGSDPPRADVVARKRYVAALAGSGRLPVWHPQRMWRGGKRDTPSPYWLKLRTGANGKREDLAEEEATKKRCKKSVSEVKHNAKA